MRALPFSLHLVPRRQHLLQHSNASSLNEPLPPESHLGHVLGRTKRHPTPALTPAAVFSLSLAPSQLLRQTESRRFCSNSSVNHKTESSCLCPQLAVGPVGAGWLDWGVRAAGAPPNHAAQLLVLVIAVPDDAALLLGGWRSCTIRLSGLRTSWPGSSLTRSPTSSMRCTPPPPEPAAVILRMFKACSACAMCALSALARNATATPPPPLQLPCMQPTRRRRSHVYAHSAHSSSARRSNLVFLDSCCIVLHPSDDASAHELSSPCTSRMRHFLSTALLPKDSAARALSLPLGLLAYHATSKLLWRTLVLGRVLAAPHHYAMCVHAVVHTRHVARLRVCCACTPPR